MREKYLQPLSITEAVPTASSKEPASLKALIVDLQSLRYKFSLSPSAKAPHRSSVYGLGAFPGNLRSEAQAEQGSQESASQEFNKEPSLDGDGG